MNDTEYGTGEGNVRTVSEILEDLKESQQQNDGGSLVDKVKNSVSSAVKGTAKSAASGVKSVASSAVSGVSSIAKSVVKEAVLGDTGDAKDEKNADFSFMNSKGGTILKAVAGIAAVAVGGAVVSNAAQQKSEEKQETPAETTDEKDSVSVPDMNNLSAQEQIVENNKRNGRSTKVMTYTDEQVESMSENDLSKLHGHTMFLANKSNPKLLDYGKQLVANQFGVLAGIAKPVRTVASKVLPDNDIFADVNFGGDDIQFAFNSAPAYEEQKSPDISALYDDKTSETVKAEEAFERVDESKVSDTPKETVEEKMARFAAMADAIAPSQQHENDLSYGFM